MTGKKVTTFKERFADLLGERPESATDLARKMHVSKQTISAWKLGDRHPNKITSVAIANFFGVNIDWLYGFDVEKYGAAKPEPVEEPNQNTTPEIKLMTRGLNKMTEEQQKLALKLVRAVFSNCFDEDEDS